MGFTSSMGGDSYTAVRSSYSGAIGDDDGGVIGGEDGGNSVFNAVGSSPIVKRVGSRVGTALGTVWRSLQVCLFHPNST